ncbi:hypothetical protein GWK90_01440 [Candidatus Hamiltonella defensa]|uniref:Uncharacterized protein n=1 Tax=Candidatus Williamhamiltonella defendens TaxID=138072 RepID=A0AAC9VJW4_9ENTR|nr:hypothetical protein [Candidatus Hamiltonella defensa]ASV34218.1 hypothetical protein CJJ18_09975 [Candidatus Hamiltonella defensa]AWK17176.1 hypothetical protein CCS40_09795 [Candidatus Hamiltonella defensa]MBK4360960.1 hypothetical protein [Candidatus Hamiltonella defensa]
MRYIQFIMMMILPLKLFANLANDLECASVEGKNMILVGRIIKFIDKDEWPVSNFVLRNEDGNNYCVQFKDASNGIRWKIIYDAFLSEQDVILKTDNLHRVIGVAVIG